MQEKSCRCGISKKRFKFDIGDFYIADCCEAKGYDVKGNLKSDVKVESIAVAALPVTAHDNATHQQSPSPERHVVLDSELSSIAEDAKPGPNEGEAPEAAPVDASIFQKFFGRAGGRGKLMDMRIEDLKTRAKQKGIVGAETMTKRQIVEALLKQPNA